MININNLTFRYENASRNCLENIQLKIRQGEFVLLCGKSGCGKTSLLRLLNGLIPNYFQGFMQGSIQINKASLSEKPMYALSAHIGTVFQNPRTQFFSTDVKSELAFGLENAAVNRNEIIRRIQLTMQHLNIEALAQKNLYQLSGGEKQKTAFASVYAMDPELYLLDEPSSNLDQAAVASFHEYLAGLKQRHKTVVIAEHRLYYLMDLVDRIIYMDQGRIIWIYDKERFGQLSLAQRESMGLRALHLSEIKPSLKKKEALPACLVIEHLSLAYQKKMVLEDVSFQVGYGEIIGITGPNGVGKTTFCRALCGCHPLAKGKIKWHRQSLDARHRQKLSYLVMQDVNYQLFSDRVEAECTLGIRGADEKLVERTLKELHLYEQREQHPYTLSGGQKQRLAVAVSCICQKEWLIFDEPTSGLDFSGMCQVSQLIRKLSAQGKIIFIVTHDIEFMQRVCTRIIHFNHGKCAEDLFITELEESHQ